MFSKPKNWISGGLWKPKNPHSLEHLKYVRSAVKLRACVIRFRGRARMGFNFVDLGSVLLICLENCPHDFCDCAVSSVSLSILQALVVFSDNNDDMSLLCHHIYCCLIFFHLIMIFNINFETLLEWGHLPLSLYLRDGRFDFN